LGRALPNHYSLLAIGYSLHPFRRQPEQCNGPGPWLRFDRDIAAMEAGQLARDGQAEADAAEPARVPGIALDEGFEDVFQLAPLDADSGIGDAEFEIALGAAAQPRFDMSLGRGELDGVAQEIDQDLLEPR
jgi:hypothetical protein